MEWCSRLREGLFRALPKPLRVAQFEVVGGATRRVVKSSAWLRRFVRAQEVLVCKLAEDKVTYIHRRLWPALVKLASRFRSEQLARTWNEHTPSGTHRSRRILFPAWVPRDVMTQARELSTADAEQILSPWLGLGRKGSRRDQ